MHKYTVWGPPYEAQTKVIGARHTFQQKKCQKCGKIKRRKIAGFGHTVGQIPADDGHLLPAPAESATVLAMPEKKESNQGREQDNSGRGARSVIDI